MKKYFLLPVFIIPLLSNTFYPMPPQKVLDSVRVDEIMTVDLSSNITVSLENVRISNCVATVPASVTIHNPTTADSSVTFKLGFFSEQRNLTYKVVAVNGQQASNQSQHQFFVLSSSESLVVKVDITMSNADFDFNKDYELKGRLLPRIVNRTPAYRDVNPGNDDLTRLVFIRSSNAICGKCLETERFQSGVQYSFSVPEIDYQAAGCQAFTALLEPNSTNGRLTTAYSRADLPKVYFEFIPSGFIEHTTVQTYHIRNRAGKYLTFVNNSPRFVERIPNDESNYQKWVILKSQNNSCGDRAYTLIQYLNGGTCKTLKFRTTGTGHYLAYTNSINPNDRSGRILILPRYKRVPPSETL